MNPTDQDGKSKTASAVDAIAYPEQGEVSEDAMHPALHADKIREKAYELWQRRGSPLGTPEEDWCRAKEELQEEDEQFRSDLQKHREQTGSVQS